MYTTSTLGPETNLWACTGKLVLSGATVWLVQITSFPRSTWISYSAGFENFTIAGALAPLCAASAIDTPSSKSKLVCCNCSESVRAANMGTTST